MVTSESLVKLVKMIAVTIWSGNSALSSVFGYKNLPGATQRFFTCFDSG